MVCFEVYRNGQLVCTAGLDGFGMLMASVGRVSLHPDSLARFAGMGVGQPTAATMALSVTGHPDAGQLSRGTLTWARSVGHRG